MKFRKILKFRKNEILQNIEISVLIFHPCSDINFIGILANFSQFFLQKKSIFFRKFLFSLIAKKLLVTIRINHQPPGR